MLEFLKDASKRYYEGTPVITDAEFDKLADLYNFNQVGYSPTNGVRHMYPMLSLNKCFDLAKAPIELRRCVQTPKLDGAAVSLLFADGILMQAITRGDGKVGQDITEKMRWLVPVRLYESKGLIQITGEVLAPKGIPNSRNYAAGALNLKSMQEFKSRDITFVAYDMTPKVEELWTETMLALWKQGIQVVTSFDVTEFPTDGTVFRIDNNLEHALAGATAHHPAGSFALKEQQVGVHTQLLDIIWQVGKSGVVSPVAILEPVLIGDATVSKATLHNIEYIRALDLEIGCTVEVIRSGEIIPRILSRVYGMDLTY